MKEGYFDFSLFTFNFSLAKHSLFTCEALFTFHLRSIFQPFSFLLCKNGGYYRK